MQNQTDALFRTAKGWDSFSEKYATKIQKNTSVFCMTLLNMLQYEQAENILDAGCGAGFLHQHIINHKMPHAHLYAFDLSSEMVKRAAARMKKYLARDQYGSLDHLTQQEVDSANFQEQVFQPINYHLSVGSIDNLSQYRDEMFDLYISNLVYQIVPDQKKAIDEAYRILKPGGRIGISVWGNKDNCAALWFLKEVAFKVGLSETGMQGGRFLKDAEIPINLAKEAGFIKILCWEQMNPFDILDLKNIENFFNPEINELLAKADESKKQLFFKELDVFIKEYRSQNLPLPFDCYLLIAQKPE